MEIGIQTTGLSYAFDTNINKLVKACEQLNIRWHSIGIVLDPYKIIGLENISKNTIFFGGIGTGNGLIENICDMNFYNPGVFFKPGMFNPNNWIGKRSDLLNENQKIITFKQLKDNWINGPIFIKSIGEKKLNGQVLEGLEKEKSTFLEEHNYSNEELFVTSPYYKIDKEWRFFIVKNKVITGSLYKRDGYLSIKEPICSQVWEQVNKMIDNWLPHETITIDICLLRSGEYKIVEFNSFTSSGLYNSDATKIVNALIKNYG